MSEAVVIAVFFALVISFTEYVSKKLNIRHKSYYSGILSFSAGVSTTYVLLELFPLFSEAAFSINKLLFLSLLGGFISHHLAEKTIYKHNRSNELVKMLSLEENVFYYTYHVILGIVLVVLINQSFVEGLFFAVSIFAFTIVSNLPSTPHHSQKRMFFLSSSTFVGTLVGLFIWRLIPPWLQFTLIGLVTGVLLFTITRHHIPHGRKGRIGYFVFGFVLYSILIVGKWFA